MTLHCTWYLYPDVTALHVTLVSWRYWIAHDTCIVTLLHCTWHLYHEVSALHVTRVSWSYCIARDTCILMLLHCTWHLYPDVTALHVTLVSWRYYVACDTCILTLLHCTWQLNHDVTALHVALASWRFCIARDNCIMKLLYWMWHLCLRDSEDIRLLDYFTFLSFMCKPSASWLRSIRIIYIYIYIYVILRYLYFITRAPWAYSWLSSALPSKFTGHKIGPQFLIPIVLYRSGYFSHVFWGTEIGKQCMKCT